MSEQRIDQSTATSAPPSLINQQPRRLKGPLALFLTLFSAVSAAAGTYLFYRNVRPGLTPWTLVELELNENAGKSRDVTSAISAVKWDDVFLAGLVVAVVVAGILGWRLFVTSWGRAAGAACMGGGLLAGLLAMAANWLDFMTSGAIHTHSATTSTTTLQAVQACALIAVVVMGLASPIAVTAAATVVVRLSAYYVLRRRLRIPDDDLQPQDGSATFPASAYWRTNWACPPGRDLGKVGICLSGGGVRSAVFGIGALQVLQRERKLCNARYLIGVSGGGYAAGAMRLALQKPDRVGAPKHAGRPVGGGGGPVRQDTCGATASNVYAEGSPEFDHLRRHSKYLAEGPAQWLGVLIAVLRGLVIAQLTLLFAAMVCGWLVGVLFGHVTALADALASPRLPAPGVGWAIAAPALAGLLFWLLAVAIETLWPNAGRRALVRVTLVLSWVGRALFILGLIMAVVCLVIPLLVSGANKLPHGLATASNTTPHGLVTAPNTKLDAKTTAATATTIVTTGYVATIVAIFTAIGRAAGSAYSWLNKNRAVFAKVPAFILQGLLVVGAATLLVVAHMYVFTRVIDYVAAPKHARFTLDLVLGRHYLPVAIGLVMLLLITVFIDQTRWSLHPFYRRRLAAAFAVRRLGDETEVYPEDEWTYLDTHCDYTKGQDFPQVILMASANVSGQDLTPPGRHALPFSLSGDWVGSPLLGWIKTSTLLRGPTETTRRGKPRRRRPITSGVLGADLTTEAAMAVSGAAFASAMGAAHSPYSLLFTLTNARLGAWLPNPRFLAHHRESSDLRESRRWAHPLLPHWRAMPYLLRELFGIYRPDGPLVLATDGGHYDNLGLVEMLRHAPSTVYCFDASGGANLGGSALGPAVTLARQELGVRITFLGSPHGVSRLEWAEKELDRAGVLVCQIDYSECPPVDGQTRDPGVLYFARATVTPDAPWQVQSYRQSHPTFPNDSTSDQWFDQEQFDAYHTLGQYAAAAVIDAQKRYEASTGRNTRAPVEVPPPRSGGG
ncbi:MAG TPA: patatin-like phospholipase family protein [Micromonosporaceae bacterium]|nr:patatin-like phospholipase family protein [Micromonosporaceae bacterium]